MNNELGFELYFPLEYLHAALIVSLLTVWVLVGLFAYLNRYTQRRYFTTWTVAWLFYALWLTLNISLLHTDPDPFWVMVKQWCVGTAAVFLLWGSAQFLEQKAGQRMIGLFMAFILIWSGLGAYYIDDPLTFHLPIFGLIGLASLTTSWCFLLFRRRCHYVGAGLLSFGFLLWGGYLITLPFFQLSEGMISSGFFISAVLQLFIAVSMIILVLEEVRTSQEEARQQVMEHKTETRFLRSKVVSTEERYRSLFDQASEAIVIAAQGDLRILELNQTARRLFNLPAGDGPLPLLASFLKVPENESLPTTGSGWYDLLCKHRRFQLVRRDGTMLMIEVDGSPIELEEQSAYQFFFHELTERARLEQQLRQAEKLSALGQMISGIAHELNNPLAVVKGYLELILARHELSPQTRTDLEKVAKESNRAAKLVSNFLSFAREQPAHRRTINLNDLIERVIELREFDFRVASIELKLDLHPCLPATQVDTDQVQQILINLLNNSVQAMAEAPLPRYLGISSQPISETTLELVIEDNGPGVPEHLVSRIFEPFFTTKEVGTGTGLGLSIAHSIMADHQGRIYYRTGSMGGAAFVLELPIVAGAPAVTHSETVFMRRTPEPQSSNSARVLILDDEKSIAELLGEMLAILGYQPTMCHSAPDALELIAVQEFDVVLSDFRMPVMDGRQFYHLAVKARPELSKRIIFLTGDVVNEETQDFLKSIGNPHIAKPFQLNKVEQAVAKVLRDARAVSIVN